MVNQSITTHFQRLSELLLSVQVTDRKGAVLPLDEGADKAVEIILSAESASPKVMVIGNGGSAAIASHAQSDLSKGAGIRAMVFNEPPLLTAFANDHGYGTVFEGPIGLWAKPGDALVAISSSGQSENIIRGVQAAMERGCQIITLSGFNPDNPLRRLGDVNFYAPSRAYGYVEIAHSALTHFLTDYAMAMVRGRELMEAKGISFEDVLTSLAKLNRSQR
jgi:D-sedoheptulose 7-phosphate isomerase